MRIEHEITDIRVVRYDTISNALNAVYGKYHLDFFTAAVQGSFRIENQPHVQVLHRSLKKQYEGAEESIYSRSCALATLEEPWKLGDFLREIDERGYCAASMSETVAYLRKLKERRVRFGAIVHLGTFIVSDEDYREKRLLVRANGAAELITDYGGTAFLRPGHEVVLSRKPPRQAPPVPAKRTFLGRLMF